MQVCVHYCRKKPVCGGLCTFMQVWGREDGKSERREDGKSGRWEEGKTERREDGKMGSREDGKKGRREDGKTGSREDGKMGRWEDGKSEVRGRKSERREGRVVEYGLRVV